MVNSQNTHKSHPDTLQQDTTMLLELMKNKDSKGARRLLFLIKNPNQTFSPYEMFQCENGGALSEPFFEDIPIYDNRYKREMVQRKNALLKLQTERNLDKEESVELQFLNQELANAYGRKNGRTYTAKRENRIRAFKKPEHSRAYAALTMSMLRLFPEGSEAKTILKRNLIFRNGKYSWGVPGQSM